MSLYTLFETDRNCETEGFRLVLQDGDVEIVFVVARAGGANKQFASKMQSLMRPHQHAAQSGNLKDQIAEDVMIKVMAESLILDWSGVADRDGEALEFNKENCTQLLTDLPELRDAIWAEANKVANFITSEREESSKN
jgi:hypothetical protein